MIEEWRWHISNQNSIRDREGKYIHRRDTTRNIYSQAGIGQLKERYIDMVKTWKKRDKEVHRHTQHNTIR